MSATGKGTGGNTPPDLQAALEHLERAVRRFAATARGELAGRAAAFIEETARRVEREIRGESRSDPRHSGTRSSNSRPRDSETSDRQRSASRRSCREARRTRRRHRRSRGNRQSVDTGDDRHTGRKLYRDPANARIAGVCAGIASYFGAEVWVARCVAVTGLIFMPSIVFPAYWILYFVLNPPPAREPGAQSPGPSGPDDHSSPAPEFGPQLSPRRSLRNLRANLAQAELRLRRIESHVTSGRYELHRELNKLDGAESGAHG